MSSLANDTVPTASESTADDLEGLLQRQRDAFERNPFPSAQERIENLNKLKNALIRQQDALVTALNRDFGCRSRDESILGDILPSVLNVRYAAKKVGKWMKPEKRHVSPMHQPAKAEIIYQPLGVVGIVVPWNYPVFLTIGPLVSALAAGNRAMIKVSEFAPETGRALRELLGSCFDEDHVAVVEGDADVARRFTSLPFDHLLFTGSTAVGRHVMRAAAENLTPVTLELGGKSPVIIDDEIPMETAVERFLWGKTFNAGQTCIAPDYVLCPEDRLESLIDNVRKQHAKFYPKGIDSGDYATIINERQYQRLSGWLDEARAKGARVVNADDKAAPDAARRYLPLTLVVNPPKDSKVAEEEIFGPILPVVTYRSKEEAGAYVRSGPRPLALYVLSFDRDFQRYFELNTHAGGMAINDTVMQVAQEDLPFGGVGPSGMGHYHGREGFLTFSKAKSVLRRGKLSFAKMLFPPYGSAVHRFIYRMYMR